MSDSSSFGSSKESIGPALCVCQEVDPNWTPGAFPGMGKLVQCPAIQVDTLLCRGTCRYTWNGSEWIADKGNSTACEFGIPQGPE